MSEGSVKRTDESSSGVQHHMYLTQSDSRLCVKYKPWAMGKGREVHDSMSEGNHSSS